MKCPKCRDTSLKRKGKPMSPERHSGPLFCPGCGGVWVTNKELSRISEYSSDAEPARTSGHPNPDEITGLCPDGHGLMIRARVHLEPHFYLEKCSSCCGIWFDRGELNRILENNLYENLAMFWTFSWQRTQRKKKGEAYYHKTNRELLGDDIYDAVIELAEKLREHPEQLRALALLHHEL